jgi:hypothetical protein
MGIVTIERYNPPAGKDIEIAQRLFDGEPVAQIARDTGYSESSIRAFAQGHRRPAIREHLDQLTREVLSRTQQRMVRAQDRAVQELERLLVESKDERIRVDCARELLRHRGGINAKEEGRPRMTALQVVQLIQQHDRANGNGESRRPHPMIDSTRTLPSGQDGGNGGPGRC